MNKTNKDDMKVITFCRKAIHHEATAAETEIKALSTDYFDIILTHDFNTTDEFIDISKMNKNHFYGNDIIAMHSYPIYLRGDDISAHKNVANYGDPFGVNASYPFLSIIQIHITPEVVARSIIEPKKKYHEYMRLFFEDIHTVIAEFAKNTRKKFIFRVYDSLSVGDFIVAIQSNAEDVAFEISTLLRRRNAKNSDGTDNVNLIMYKTYTVLSIDNYIVNNGSDWQEETCDHDSKFVLKCCLSNKFWSEKERYSKKISAVKGIIKKHIERTNGRYDVTVSLNRDEFFRFLPLVAQFKKGIPEKEVLDKLKAEADAWAPNDNNWNIIDYLKYMLAYGYFSYVNEKCQMNFDEPEYEWYKNLETEIKVRSIEEAPRYLDEINQKIYEALYHNFQQVYSNMRKVNSYRKNLLYHMSLLERLIKLCDTINGVSDIRIYSSVLMSHLVFVINGLKYYIELIEEVDGNDVSTRNIMDSMEESLRRSIQAIDSYAGYIRNNNLQPLQTPNYNLEGNFSVEKYLIAYSEFLSSVINQYNNCVAKTIGEMENEIMPIFEPDSLHDSISVSVLFRNIDIVKKRNLYTETKKEKTKKLMLVRCATFKEVMNAPEIVTALLHEVAHQFRYETREQRNDFLTQSCAEIISKGIITKLLEKAKMQIKWLNPKKSEIEFFEEALTKSYIKTVKEDLNKHNNKTLYSYRGAFMDTMNAMYNQSIFISDIEHLRVVAVEAVKFKVDIFDSEVQDYFNTILEFEKFVKSNGDIVTADKDEFEERLKKVCEKMEKLKTVCEDEELKSAVDSYKRYQNDVDGIYKFLSLSYSIDDVWKSTYEELYHWEETVNSPVMGDDPLWRYLGVDFNHPDNKAEFVREVNEVFRTSHKEICDAIENFIIQYREYTADMFMFKAMQLTPFGYMDFMMRIIPIDAEVPMEYIKRFVYVIVAINGEDRIEAIIENLKYMVDNAVEKLTVLSNKKLLNEKLPEIRFEHNDEDELPSLVEKCTCLASKLMAYDMNDKFEDLIAEYLHCGKMYVLCIQLEGLWMKETKELLKNRTLHEDLILGVGFLEKVKDNFFDEDTLTACRNFGKYWNSVEIHYGKNKSELQMLNGTVVNFIQSLYYLNKFKNAKKCHEWGERHD